MTPSVAKSLLKFMEFLKKIWRPLLALTLISILIKKGPFQLDQLKLIFTHPTIVVLGFVIFFFQVIIFSVRWRLFISLLTKVSFLKTVQLNLVGYFFNHFIPGGVGGDIVKALELSKNKNISRSQALSTALSDRVFGLFAMISFTFIFLNLEYLINKDQFLIKFMILSTVLFLGIITSLLFMPNIFVQISKRLSLKNSPFLLRVEKIISTLHFTFITFKNIKIQIKSFLLSLVGQLLVIYFMYEVVRILGAPQPSFFVFAALCCFCFVVSAVPLFPAGIGVGQAAIYFMFSNISVELGKAAVIAITALQIFNLFYALIGGVVFSFMPKLKKEIASSI